MQPDKAHKEALMEELKHFINGKFDELKKELFNSKPAMEGKKPSKVTREKAVRE